MASALFNPLNDHGQEDFFSTPVVLPSERYVFKTPYIILLKDKAQAATNVIKELFPDFEIHECICMTHSSIIGWPRTPTSSGVPMCINLNALPTWIPNTKYLDMLISSKLRVV